MLPVGEREDKVAKVRGGDEMGDEGFEEGKRARRASFLAFNVALFSESVLQV